MYVVAKYIAKETTAYAILRRLCNGKLEQIIPPKLRLTDWRTVMVKVELNDIRPDIVKPSNGKVIMVSLKYIFCCLYVQSEVYDFSTLLQIKQ